MTATTTPSGIDHYIDLTAEELLFLFHALDLPVPTWLYGDATPTESDFGLARSIGARALSARGIVKGRGDKRQIAGALGAALRVAGHPAIVSHIITAGPQFSTTLVFTAPGHTVSIGLNPDGNRRLRMVPVGRTLSLLAVMADFQSSLQPSGAGSTVIDLTALTNPAPDAVTQLTAHDAASAADALIATGVDPIDAAAFAEIFAPEAKIHTVATAVPQPGGDVRTTRTTWVTQPDGATMLVTGSNGEMTVTECSPDEIVVNLVAGYPSPQPDL